MNDNIDRYINGNNTARELISLFSEGKIDDRRGFFDDLDLAREKIIKNTGKVKSKNLEK